MHRQIRKASVYFRYAFKNLVRHPWVLGGLGSVALFGMVTASAIVSRTGERMSPDPIQPVLEHLASPATTLVNSGTSLFVHEERVQSSDTLATLFSRLGINDPEALAFVNQNPEARNLVRQMQQGKTVTARTGPGGELVAIYIPVNGQDAVFAIEKKNDNFVVGEQPMNLTTRILIGSGEIVSSLFAAMDDVGIPDSIASQLSEIFSGDIDFYRDLHKGDKFSVIFESLVYNGHHIRSGRILAAEIDRGTKTYRAHWFQPEEGKGGGYYTDEGKNLRKLFLRSPLEFSRVTSGFSTARFHPILHTLREHRGVDYAAPLGTRVRAIADGIVEFVGWQNGFGNVIILRHQGRYSTVYGHLNGFAPEVLQDGLVYQGDTIGFVGKTGLATGPHLHFELRNNGQQVNPLTLVSPGGVPLDEDQLDRFKDASANLRYQLDLIKQTQMPHMALAN